MESGKKAYTLIFGIRSPRLNVSLELSLTLMNGVTSVRFASLSNLKWTSHACKVPISDLGLYIVAMHSKRTVFCCSLSMVREVLLLKLAVIYFVKMDKFQVSIYACCGKLTTVFSFA